MNRSDCYDCRQKDNCKLYLFVWDHKKSLNDTTVIFPKITYTMHAGQLVEDCKGLKN